MNNRRKIVFVQMVVNKKGSISIEAAFIMPLVFIIILMFVFFLLFECEKYNSYYYICRIRNDLMENINEYGQLGILEREKIIDDAKKMNNNEKKQKQKKTKEKGEK